jgi:hypothetical protein
MPFCEPLTTFEPVNTAEGLPLIRQRSAGLLRTRATPKAIGAASISSVNDASAEMDAGSGAPTVTKETTDQFLADLSEQNLLTGTGMDWCVGLWGIEGEENPYL